MSAKGLKRICTNCRTPFYDFNKRPVVCPKCQTEITVVRDAKMPVEDISKKPAAFHEEETMDAERNTISLDEIEENDDEDEIDEEELMRVEEDLDLDSIDDHLEDDD